MTSEASAGNGPDFYRQLHPLESHDVGSGKLVEFNALLKEITKEENDTSECFLPAKRKKDERLQAYFVAIRSFQRKWGGIAMPNTTTGQRDSTSLDPNNRSSHSPL
jgi:hypothetical protein